MLKNIRHKVNLRNRIFDANPKEPLHQKNRHQQMPADIVPVQRLLYTIKEKQLITLSVAYNTPYLLPGLFPVLLIINYSIKYHFIQLIRRMWENQFL